MSEKLQPENEEIVSTPEELANEVINESEKVDSNKNLFVILERDGDAAAKEVLLANKN